VPGVAKCVADEQVGRGPDQRREPAEQRSVRLELIAESPVPVRGANRQSLLYVTTTSCLRPSYAADLPPWPRPDFTDYDDKLRDCATAPFVLFVSLGRLISIEALLRNQIEHLRRIAQRTLRPLDGSAPACEILLGTLKKFKAAN
jgi:hypothetical protein